MIGFFFFSMIVVLGILVLVGGLQSIQARGKRLEEGSASPAQLDRMEAALGLLESRVDDLQQQQRFLERLLADRPERPRLSEGTDAAEDSDESSVLFDIRPAEEEEPH